MKIKNLIIRFAATSLLVGLLFPLQAGAAGELANRSATVGSSAAGAATTYAFSFKPATAGNIGAIKFQICDSPLEVAACVNTGGSSGASFTAAGASIQGETNISGFTAGAGSPPAPTTNAFWITNATPQNIGTGTQVTVTLQNVQNPSASNTEYYVRMTTYSDSAGTAEVDFGAAALDTTNQITVSGTMPESLVFCVGTSGTNCTNISGSTVNLGTFSPASTNVGTSVMSASTNAGSGYAITMNGTTLTSGSNTIPALAAQTASSIGVSQFGVNLVGNNVASAGGVFGANPSGSGSGGVGGAYATTNQFRFDTGDIVASAAAPTDANLYTTSYLVNVEGAQAAGLYTATFTYICTATF